LISYNSHASSTSSHSGLDDYWETNLFDEAVGKVIRLDGTFRTRYNWNTGLSGCGAIDG
jgi:hypothetical protein